MHSTISRWLTAASATALALALATAPAVAQACLGLGTLDGQGFAAGSAGFTDGAWGPGGAIGYDAPGPVTVGAEGTYSFVDNSDSPPRARGRSWPRRCRAPVPPSAP